MCWNVRGKMGPVEIPGHISASQRSIHNASIFRLLLKVAVTGALTCELQPIFLGPSGSDIVTYFKMCGFVRSKEGPVFADSLQVHTFSAFWL